MRYVTAMLFAVVAAALTMRFLASDVATRVVATYKFDSPDQVADLHTAIFMGVNLVGLAAGWALGWAIASAVTRGPKQAQ